MSQPPPNPYAPPRFESDLVHAQLGAAPRREGDFAVIPVRGASFPGRCVVCNAPAERRLRRKLYWHPPGIYALVCLGLLVYVIGALITRKNAEFEIAVCEDHAARRRNGIFIGWLGLGALVASLLLIEQSPLFPIIGSVLLLGGLIAALLMAQVVTAKRIDERQAWLKVGRPFLDSL